MQLYLEYNQSFPKGTGKTDFFYFISKFPIKRIKKEIEKLRFSDYLIIYLQRNEKQQNLKIMKISFSKQTKERAFKQLYEEYYAPFCLYAKRFVDDKETREDIVSDVQK